MCKNICFISLEGERERERDRERWGSIVFVGSVVKALKAELNHVSSRRRKGWVVCSLGVFVNFARHLFYRGCVLSLVTLYMVYQ